MNKRRAPTEHNQPIPPTLHFNQNFKSISEVPAEELARQITLVQFDHFKAIGPSEFLKKNWSNDEKKEILAPNIVALARLDTTVILDLSQLTSFY